MVKVGQGSTACLQRRGIRQHTFFCSPLYYALCLASSFNDLQHRKGRHVSEEIRKCQMGRQCRQSIFRSVPDFNVSRDPRKGPPTNHSSSDTCHLGQPYCPHHHLTTTPQHHHHHCLTGALLLGRPFRLQAIDLQVVKKNWLRVLYRCFCCEQWFCVVDCTDQLLANQILFLSLRAPAQKAIIIPF